MKKHLHITAFVTALLLLTATACNSGGDNKAITPSEDPASVAGESQTLTVLATENDSTINLFVDIAMVKYPNMVIEFVDKKYYDLEDESAFLNKVAGEIMAGGGPDIISPKLFKNLGNAVENGVFENLSPYLEKDADFKKEDYADAIMAASTFDNQQLLIPIDIQIPLYITTQAFEQKYGFKGKNLYEVVDIQAKNNVEGNPFEHYYEPLFINDYANKTTGIGEPEFTNFVKQRRNLSSQIEAKNNMPVPFEKNPLVYVPGMPNLNTYVTMCTNMSEQPVILPALDEQGKFTGQLIGLGINANSKNKQAAYDFLKIAFTMSSDVDEALKQKYEKHEGYLSAISPNAYCFFANKSMQNKLFDEYFEMYKTGALYGSDNSIVDATKVAQDAVVKEYSAFYDSLDRCQYSPAYRYSQELLDYIYKKAELSDAELESLIKKESDKAKVAISE